MERLATFVNSSFEFVHICDLFKSGMQDREWVPSLAGNNWVIITADAGKNSVKNDKLPSLCKQHELTHIVLGNRLHSQKSVKKLAVLRELWPDIETTMTANSGTRFKILFLPTNAGIERFVLKPDAS